MCDSGWTCHAIIDIIPGGTLNYTPKYYLLKNILKPRLAGLFGKTLKKLTPTDQLLNVESFITYDFLKLRYYMTEYLPGSYDLGFFKDSDNLDYFMLLSRW